MKKIALANKSRSNREFFDELIRVLAVELNQGGTELLPGLLLPSWTQYHKDTMEAWKRVDQILSPKTIADINKMLQKSELKACNSIPRIKEYLTQETDFTDCHLTALNEFSVKYRECRT